MSRVRAVASMYGHNVVGDISGLEIVIVLPNKKDAEFPFNPLDNLLVLLDCMVSCEAL